VDQLLRKIEAMGSAEMAAAELQKTHCPAARAKTWTIEKLNCLKSRRCICTRNS